MQGIHCSALPCHEQISDDFSDFSSIIKIPSKNYPVIFKNRVFIVGEA